MFCVLTFTLLISFVWPVPLCPSKVSFLTDEDCNKYWRCHHSLPYLMYCPPGLHFNSKLNICDWPKNAGCLTSAARPDCPKVDGSISVYFPHKDCGKFWQCSNGVPYVHDCSIGLHFNQLLNVCDYPDRAGCEKKTQEVTTITSSDTSSTAKVFVTTSTTEKIEEVTTTCTPIFPTLPSVSSTSTQKEIVFPGNNTNSTNTITNTTPTVFETLSTASTTSESQDELPVLTTIISTSHEETTAIIPNEGTTTSITPTSTTLHNSDVTSTLPYPSTTSQDVTQEDDSDNSNAENQSNTAAHTVPNSKTEITTEYISTITAATSRSPEMSTSESKDLSKPTTTNQETEDNENCDHEYPQESPDQIGNCSTTEATSETSAYSSTVLPVSENEGILSTSSSISRSIETTKFETTKGDSSTETSIKTTKVTTQSETVVEETTVNYSTIQTGTDFLSTLSSTSLNMETTTLGNAEDDITTEASTISTQIEVESNATSVRELSTNGSSNVTDISTDIDLETVASTMHNLTTDKSKSSNLESSTPVDTITYTATEFHTISISADTEYETIETSTKDSSKNNDITPDAETEKETGTTSTSEQTPEWQINVTTEITSISYKTETSTSTNIYISTDNNEEETSKTISEINATVEITTETQEISRETTTDINDITIQDLITTIQTSTGSFTSSPSAEEELLYICQRYPSEVYQAGHPSDCTLYISCVFGEISLIRCPPGTWYNARQMTCVEPENSGCRINYINKLYLILISIQRNNEFWKKLFDRTQNYLHSFQQ